ncbi:MAG: hypothetical protein E7648_03500 [Ruminococcaceae bacterium]|nr:hypothetical protein [Oscillospiraceae bacterium]
MRTRLSSVISLFLATVLVLGTLFTSCSPKKKESQAAKYLEKIMEATFSGLEDTAPQATTSKFTFNSTADFNIPHLVGAQMTLISGINGESFADSEITLDSGKVDLSVYNVGTTVVVGSSAIGATKYGFELSDASTIMNLFGSMFVPSAPEVAPADGLGNVAPESSASGLLGALDGINSLLDGENPEKVYAILEKYVAVISDAAESACKSDVKTGDEITVTVEFNTASAKKLLKDVFSSLKKDKELKSILESALVAGGLGKPEAKVQVEALLSDDALKAIFDMLDASPFTFAAIFCADKNYVLNGISIEYASQGAKTSLFFDAKTEGKVEVGYSASVTVDGAFHRQEQKIVFESKTDLGADVFEISRVEIVDNNAYAETILKTTVKDGKYSVTVRVNDEVEGPYNVTLAGDIEAEGSKSTITLTSATAFGTTLMLDVKVETETGGTVPAIPTNFKNILDVTGDEFKVIMNNLKNSPLGQFMPEADSEIVLPDVQ